MAFSLRRLASDHASLHNDGMPPHYLFPPSSAFSPFPDDLTQLTVLLTGPQGTPYSQGLWQLHLRIPEDYPKSPPKAAFMTRIWHPNVDESTGAVCVDTLKRDWEAKLTLRDVLITISCLLIQPNPDSALNSAAGSLLQDDYEAFARQAKLMTAIHAPIPREMKDAVMEAKRRGDDSGAVIIEDEPRPATIASRKTTTATSLSTVIMKNPATHRKPNNQRIEKLDIRVKETSRDGVFSSQSSSSPFARDQQPTSEDESDTEDTGSASKENDPSLSPSPVTITPSSPRKSVLGKRPLAVLASPSEPDLILVNSGGDDVDASTSTHSHDDDDGMTPSERNIAANPFVGVQQQQQLQRAQQVQPREEQPRKSPKLSEPSRGVNASGRVRDDYPDQASALEHNSNKDSHGNGSSQVDRGSRQSSVFGAPSPQQPLLQSSNGKRSDGGKENEASSSASVIPVSAIAASASATATTTSFTDKPQQQRQKQKLPPPSSLLSGSSMDLSSPPSSNKIKVPPPPHTSSIPLPKASTNNNSNIDNNSSNNSSLTTRRVSSVTMKTKPRVGLRRL